MSDKRIEQDRLAKQVQEALYGRGGGEAAFGRFLASLDDERADHARLIEVHTETLLQLDAATAALDLANAKVKGLESATKALADAQQPEKPAEAAT